MKTLLKQAIGIDCAKDDFMISYGKYYSNTETEILFTKNLENDKKGFLKLENIIKKTAIQNMPVFIVMEATGVYHEKLADFLYDKGYPVIIVLPQRAKAFMKTLKSKTVNDKEASKGLTVMGLEKKLDLWVKPDAVFRVLKQLTREREQVQRALTQTKNQLHAEKHCAYPNKNTIKRMNKLIKVYETQIIEIVKDIEEIIKANPPLQKKLEYLLSIPSIGLITAVTAIAETNGFNLMKNKKQLVSYAGYDVINKESGISVRGKPHISHKGNRHIRKAMHMPALTAIRCNKNNKELFERLLCKHGIKMKAVVAVQRKLLTLMFTLWKKEEYYDEKKYCCIKIEQPNMTALNELVLDRSNYFLYS